MKRLLLASLFAAASCAEAPLPPPQAPTRPESSRSVPRERQARDPAQLKMACEALIAQIREEMDDPFLRCIPDLKIDVLFHACKAVFPESDLDALLRKADENQRICLNLPPETRDPVGLCNRLLDDTQAAITKASTTCAEADLQAMEKLTKMMDRACEKLPEKKFPLPFIVRASAYFNATLTRDKCELDETIDRINEGLPR